MRRMAVMVLALGSLALRAQADDTVRLFSPVPAGPVTLQAPARQTADAPPRALGIRPALDLDEPVAQTPAQANNAPWQVAPQATPKAPATTKTAAWQAVTSTPAAPAAASPAAPH